MQRVFSLLLFLSAAILLQAQPVRILAGCYNDDAPEQPGALLLQFDPQDGGTVQLAAAATRNPSFIIPSADRRFAWSVCEFHDGTQGAYAYHLAPDGLAWSSPTSACAT